MCVFYVLNLCSVSFLPRFSLTDLTSCYSLGYVSCFHTVVQKQQHLEQPRVFATGFSVTGNPGIEWTYCNSTPATNTLTHTHKGTKKSNNREENKFMTTFCHHTLWPQSSTAQSQTAESWHTTWSCLLSMHCYSLPILALWLEELGHRQLLLRAPTCGISTSRAGAGLDQISWLRHYVHSQCQVETSVGFDGCIICKFGDTCIGWMSRYKSTF